MLYNLKSEPLKEEDEEESKKGKQKH